MNSFLETGKNLPPGLWLPTAEESAEQYLTENFTQRGELEPEDIVDYGSFVVALAALGAEETGRISLMPRERDFQKMHEAGYGIRVRALGYYGGLRWLQTELHFCPDGVNMGKPDLIARLSWLANYAYPSQHGSEAINDLTIEDLIRWGASRDLVPGSKRTREILGNDTLEIRRLLGMERKVTSGSLSKTDLYRFGQKVLAEHDRPLTSRELATEYPNEFISDTYETIRWNFGSLTKFWMEFGRLSSSARLDRTELIELGVRRLITHREQKLYPSTIEQLSKDRVFVSKIPLRNEFGGIPAYRVEVEKAYKNYVLLRDSLAADGVSEEVMRVACRRFEDNPEFINDVRSRSEVLARLSWPAAAYTVQRLAAGFDLLHDSIFELQWKDFHSGLRRVGITEPADIRYVLGLVPQFDAEEGMKLLTK